MRHDNDTQGKDPLLEIAKEQRTRGRVQLRQRSSDGKEKRTYFSKRHHQEFPHNAKMLPDQEAWRLRRVRARAYFTQQIKKNTMKEENWIVHKVSEFSEVIEPDPGNVFIPLMNYKLFWNIVCGPGGLVEQGFFWCRRNEDGTTSFVRNMGMDSEAGNVR